jgi:hypothetical protein
MGEVLDPRISRVHCRRCTIVKVLDPRISRMLRTSLRPAHGPAMDFGDW